MSDAPETAFEVDAPTPAEADVPDETQDEVTEATPPNPEEAEDAPEAN